MIQLIITKNQIVFSKFPLKSHILMLSEDLPSQKNELIQIQIIIMKNHKKQAR